MDDTNNHSPAYFAFIPGMPVMVTKNVLQSLGIANGSGFTAVDVLPDASSERIDLPGNIVVHSRPPTCLLVASKNTKDFKLPGLDPGVVPLLPISEPVIQRGSPYAWRMGLPCTPAFAITDYKSQSQTFDKIALDIDIGSTFSSMHVGLSRCRTLEGVSLLRPIPIAVWNKKPNDKVSVTGSLYFPSTTWTDDHMVTELTDGDGAVSS
jgi:hypothetical protein